MPTPKICPGGKTIFFFLFTKFRLKSVATGKILKNPFLKIKEKRLQVAPPPLYIYVLNFKWGGCPPYFPG